MRMISAQEGRARVPARVAAQGAIATGSRCEEPTWAHVRYTPIDYQAISYYSAPEGHGHGAEEPGRGRSEAARDLRQARHPAARARAARGRGGRRGVRQRLGRDHVQGQAGGGRRHLLLVLRGGAEPSGAGPAVPRHGRALSRQLLRDAELRGVHRRLVRLHAEGRALPDGAVDVLPHQRREDRPVRAHADHRRRRQPRELPRRLHGADARREPAARRGRRARGARRRARSSTRPCRTGTPATSRAAAASTTS